MILRRFAGPGDQDIDAGIDEALASIGRFAGVDRSYMFTIDGDFLNNSHEWCGPGISPEIHNLQQVPYDTIYWWRPRLTSGEPIYIPSVAQLPEERAAERELLGAQGIKSLIVVPLIGPDQTQGFIGFDSVHEHRVVAVICSRGHELGMKTIAEGIESEVQLEMLQGMRCDLAQGFHLARPTTPEMIVELLSLQQPKLEAWQDSAGSRTQPKSEQPSQQRSPFTARARYKAG